MSLYRKRPVVIDAFKLGHDPMPDWFMDRVSAATITLHGGHPRDRGSLTGASIRTLEGVMTADRGDFIIQGVKGEIYPCKPDIFEATYEAAGTERTDP
jgi:hypothetical protein